MSERAKCRCLECRIRAAMFGGKPTEPFEIDTGEAIAALGNILAEMLAHHDDICAEAFTIALLEHREQWLKHPRVLVQQPPRGNA